jgi:hypothetical protein
LRVTDHKSGKFDGNLRQVIDGGKTLQPVLYALAAEKLFAGEGTVTGPAPPPPLGLTPPATKATR